MEPFDGNLLSTEFADARLADWTVLAGRWYYRCVGDYQVDLSEDHDRKWVVSVHQAGGADEETESFHSFKDAVECALAKYSEIARKAA